MMKSYKALLNETAKGTSELRELSQEESLSLKKCILDIFRAVSKTCNEHNLTYMLAGGSCLGAVRHQGFIPWDDDLDLLMPRPDYEEFLSLISQGVLGPEYDYSYPDGIHDSPAMFLKIYKKGTRLVSFGDSAGDYPQKVFIDVFPLDGMPSNPLFRWLKGHIADFIRLSANMVLESGNKSEAEKRFISSNIQLKRVVKRRRMLGRILSIFSHCKWVFWFDRFVCNKDMSGMIGIPTGRKLYNGEVFNHSVYLPVSYGQFETISVPLPNNTAQYLTNLYRNYMEVPPEEKRERHFFFEIEIPE